MAYRNLVVLTGAGVSAESGVPTFRDAGGLWEGHRFEEVATAEAFSRDPALVQRFYNERRQRLGEVEPNLAHRALAELAARWLGDFLLVTQNVDDLHDRALAEVEPAPAFRLIHMHGELRKARCTATGATWDCYGELTAREGSPFHDAGFARPHVVWFGEMPLEMDAIEEALERCDLFVAIGTSGLVYPAAGFVQLAYAAGARTVEINLQRTAGSGLFHEGLYGPATEVVPEFCERLLAG